MATYAVTMIEDYPLDSRTLYGLGKIERGYPRQMELTDDQVRSLRGRGIEVHPWQPPAPRKSKPKPELDTPAAEPAQEE